VRTANKIRFRSLLLMVINIIFTIAGGIALLDTYGVPPFFAILTWIGGLFLSLLLNAVLHGFADHIDNTYAYTCKAYGIPIIPVPKEGTSELSFRLPNPENEEEWEKYTKALLDNGWISEEEYKNMIWNSQED
jgi:hypothetical protein